MKNIKALIALVILGTILAACTVPEVVTNPDGTVSTNLVVDPRVTQGLNTAKAVTQLTAPMNPYAEPIITGLSVLSTAAVAWGSIATFFQRRNKKLLATVVRGVEAAGTQSNAVKESIEKTSEKAGVALQLDSAVQRIITGN